MPPKCAAISRGYTVDRGAIGEVERPAARGAAGAFDFANDFLEVRLVQIDRGDFGAFVGEQLRGRPTHAAGGAGDDGDLARNRSAEFGESCHVAP